MSAPADNTFTMKFNTPEERAKLQEDYIKHRESVLSRECLHGFRIAWNPPGHPLTAASGRRIIRPDQTGWAVYRQQL